MIPCYRCEKLTNRNPGTSDPLHIYCSKSCAHKASTLRKRPPIRFEDKLVYIPLTQGLWTKVDLSDYQSIDYLKSAWCVFRLRNTIYAARAENIKSNYVFMHNVIMDTAEGFLVDHKDFDGLNNTRNNLRIATFQQNVQHRRKYKTRQFTSQYKGVCYNKKDKLWWVFVDHKLIGRFKDEDEAALIYNNAAIISHGEFAELNIVPQKKITE